MMRGAFVLQRGLANDLAFPLSDPERPVDPQLVTCRQVIEMMTIAGAAGSGLLDKVGTLTPGKEADIVMLDAHNINTQPMNNASGTVVTMMNQRHVRHVMIAGKIVFRDGELVGWNIQRLLDKVEKSRDRRAHADQRSVAHRSAGEGTEQRGQSVPAELPRLVLLRRSEHDGAGVRAAAVDRKVESRLWAPGCRFSERHPGARYGEGLEPAATLRSGP